MWSCDNEPYVQKYILANHNPDNLFFDLADLSKTVAFCFKQEKPCVVQKTDNSAIGWVCKTASRQNPQRNKRCIEEASGQTGQTFREVKQFLSEDHSSGTFIGENVNALDV